ncbi:MAG: PQQ-binding-like beta-propeller repeat protein [Planctomycetota bacterium]
MRTLPFAAVLLTIVAACSSAASTKSAGHRVILQGNDRLAILGASGAIEWEMPWGGIHDLQMLKDGHILVQQGAAKVAEIDPASKQVVWSHDSAATNGNAGHRVEVHAFQPLPDGGLMIAESGPGRLIEIDHSGAVRHAIALHVEHPDPHRDTRLVRRLPSGNWLVCHEGDGCVREYDGRSGTVVWDYPVPLFGHERKDGHGPEAFGNQCFCALRLPSGNTLIATGNGHSVLEVTPQKEIVWKLDQRDLPGIVLAWVTTLEVLPNGHYVIGNCHAGPGQPLLIEIEPRSKQVLWTLDRYDDFGNAVSNAVLLDADSLR